MLDLLERNHIQEILFAEIFLKKCKYEKNNMKIYMEDNMCTIFKLVFHKMQKFLVLNGQTIVEEPENADLIITGVCAAFEADESRSVRIVSKMKKSMKPIYGFGCMTRINPDRLKLKSIFASWEGQKLVETIVKNPKIGWGSIDLPTDFRNKNDYRVYNSKRHFVGISTGCAFWCSYCPHKLGVGKIVSRPEKEILNQIKTLIESGAETIVLTGTDVACYGQDIGTSFPLLLEKILNIVPQKIEVHIAQFNPQGLRFDFEKLIKACQDKRVTDFQLPVQTASKRILKLMNRYYSMKEVRKFIVKVKKKNTNIRFRTDLIIGFPTETEANFRKTVGFVIKHFDEVAAYAFELKRNTPLVSYNLPLLNKSLIITRLNKALKVIRREGLLAHSGGQDIFSLICNDQVKEKIAMERKYEES